MLSAGLREALAGALDDVSGDDLDARPASGGSICRAFHLRCGKDDFFLKLHDAAHAAMFDAEFEGLAALRASGAIRVPAPIARGVADGTAWLLLEYVPMGSSGPAGMARLGAQLAAMHRCLSENGRFGWHRDNTIGSTPQPNGWMADWADFWRERRLRHQLALLARKGAPRRLLEDGERLCERVPVFIDHAPAPSLLHGDLWGGNKGFDASGTPVIFDPATYYGDREADLAMTELFGGFSADFHDAYRAEWPLDAGYAVRRDLYNLYHVLNHANLFGGGYAAQAQAMIARLLAEAA
ncbi:MAG: fructosamine kinase family protein [Mariprofundaceae bacterium]